MGTLACGFSQIEITPDPKKGVYMDGYSRRLDPAEGVRDPLYVKVCAIEASGERFVIAAFDICGFHEELKERLRAAVRQFTGLEDHQFAICATHTHAGPACGILKHFPVNWIYWNEVCMRTVKAIRQAMENTCPGDFRFGFGMDLCLPFNRRQKESIDRRVQVCGFFDRDNRLKGVIASASCHPVCITDLYLSADYPAILTERAAKQYPGTPFLFLQGRGADVDPDFPDGDRVAMQPKLGNEFADSVLGALEKLTEKGSSRGSLRSAYRTVQVPMTWQSRDLMEGELEQRKRRILETENEREKMEAEVEFFWFIRSLRDQKEGKRPEIAADLQMLHITGTAVFLFLPFEILTPTGNELEQMLIRQGFDPKQCFVIGYSNGVNGYLTPSAECTADDYETCVAAYWYDLPGIYCTDSEKTVLKSMEEMADALCKKGEDIKS